MTRLQGVGIKCLQTAGIDMPHGGPPVKEHLFTGWAANPGYDAAQIVPIRWFWVATAAPEGKA